MVSDPEHESGPVETIMDSINVAVASQGFVIAIIPIYNEMKKEARPKVGISILSALTFTVTAYTILSCISLSYFG